MKEGNIKVANISPLEKDELTIDEYNKVFDLFYADIVLPYCKQHGNIIIEGPTSDQFDPLNHISEEALEKLGIFCNIANKSTGSLHHNDEERWFEFICQTVDDNKMFDYDTLFRFLMDEEYWKKKNKEFVGSMGRFAWDEKNAEKLAKYELCPVSYWLWLFLWAWSVGCRVEYYGTNIQK